MVGIDTITLWPDSATYGETPEKVKRDEAIRKKIHDKHAELIDINVDDADSPVVFETRKKKTRSRKTSQTEPAAKKADIMSKSLIDIRSEQHVSKAERLRKEHELAKRLNIVPITLEPIDAAPKVINPPLLWSYPAASKLYDVDLKKVEEIFNESPQKIDCMSKSMFAMLPITPPESYQLGDFMENIPNLSLKKEEEIKDIEIDEDEWEIV